MRSKKILLTTLAMILLFSGVFVYAELSEREKLEAELAELENNLSLEGIK